MKSKSEEQIFDKLSFIIFAESVPSNMQIEKLP
jgi:hypothetical protein